MIGYSIWLAPTEEERREQWEKQQLEREKERIQDSIALAEREEAEDKPVTIKEEETKKEIIADPELAKPDTIIEIEKDKLLEKFGVFTGSAKGEKEFYTLENEVLRLQISKQGGYIHSVELKKYLTYDQKPLKLFYGNDDKFFLNFFYGNRHITTKDFFFEPHFDERYLKDENHIEVEPGDSTNFAMRLYVDTSTDENPKYLEFSYGLTGNKYMIDFNISFVGLHDVVAANTRHINLDWKINMPRQEKNRDYEQSTSSIYYRFATQEIDDLRTNRDDSESIKTSVHWISFKQQFFSSIIIAENNFLNAEVKSNLFDDDNEDFLKKLSASMDMPYSPREDNHYPMRFYFGPNHYQVLSKYDIDLERQIPLGWGIFGWINRFAIIPVFNFLDGFDINYGIIILMLTVMLKIILLPIAYKTYISSARMRVLKPEIEELGKKFPKKEDAMKKQQATMALYKKAGVNPMAGCVPMLLQLPILIAMFRFFPASIELRQESFLWADDLSSYDSILDLPFSLPFYGDHVSLFTLLMAVSTVIYTRMNSQMMGSTNQMPGMKTMMYMMPVMLLAIFNSFASALSYYYFLTNIITFGQMGLFRKLINEDAIHKKIEESKKKPVKKSKWQKKLEDVSKQRANQAKRKK